MSADLVVPALGESISQATVLNWRRSPGDPVARNEVLVELETDKVTVEVEAPDDGILLEISARDGDEVAVGSVIGRIGAARAAAAPDPSDAGTADRPSAASGAAAVPAEPEAEARTVRPVSIEAGRPAAADRARDAPSGPVEIPPAAAEGPPDSGPASGSAAGAAPDLPDPAQVRRSGRGERITADDLREFLGALERPLSPAVRRAVREHGVDPAAVAPTGPRGRIVKDDVRVPAGQPPAAGSIPEPVGTGRSDEGGPNPTAGATAPASASAPGDSGAARGPKPAAAPVRPRVRRVPMSRFRRRLAERLKEAQNTAAMLTTYNEVDMSAVAALRKAGGDAFRERHGVRLGLMSFFVKACVSALRAVPELNAEIDGTDVVYKDFYDLGIAVHSERGLVVPVIRDADRKGFADIEREIRDFRERADAGTLAADELQGGTFTVSNGGVYGSLMSAPILNPPQSGILGLHRIQERPVARDGQVVVRPMMYLALSYDHRIVDGKGAVTFLVRLLGQLEQPAVLALDT